MLYSKGMLKLESEDERGMVLSLMDDTRFALYLDVCDRLAEESKESLSVFSATGLQPFETGRLVGKLQGQITTPRQVLRLLTDAATELSQKVSPSEDVADLESYRRPSLKGD